MMKNYIRNLTLNWLFVSKQLICIHVAILQINNNAFAMQQLNKENNPNFPD
jgi:hypothetical protein